MSASVSATAGEFFNVRDFGAAGDYATDDTAAFQAAIDACHAASLATGGRRVLEVPGGDYRVGSLELPGGVVLSGDGPGVTRLFSRDNGQATIELANPARTVAGVQIDGISFFSGGRGGTAVRLQGADADRRIVDVRIDNCRFSEFDTAVSLRLCGNVWLDQLHAASCATGFRIDTCADVRASQCFADNGSGWGFHVSAEDGFGASSEGVQLFGCTTNGQGGGLLVENQHWGAAIGCSFTTSTGPAVSLDAHGWRILAAEIATAASGAPGLVLGPDAENCVVTGSYFALNSTAIKVDGTGHLISDNIIETGLDGLGDIVIAGRNNVVSGNQARSVAAVSIQETASADGNLIDGNLVRGTIALSGGSSVATPTNYGINPATGSLQPVPAPPDDATAGPPLLLTDTTTNQSSTPALAPYSGPVSYLAGEFVYLGSNSVALVAAVPDVFLRTGAGDDALTVTAGRNVLDAGAGSNFLTGGSGPDTFFLDARTDASAVWSTLIGFSAGDGATVWGIAAGEFDISWVDNQGAAGFTGLTMHATSPGKPDISLTLTGVTEADRSSGRLSVAFGHDPDSGSDYMYVHL